MGTLSYGMITTADGVAEAIVATPPEGSGPGVLFFMDAFGLRPRIEHMAAQIAGWGYVVLAPNVFYRDGTVAGLAPTSDLSTPAGREAFWQVAGPRIGSLTPEKAVADNDAYLSALGALPGVWPGAVGVVGFCMGTRLAIRAAGRHPGLVAACAGFHGGGLVTEAPDSPHQELATASAEFVFGHADNDASMTAADSAALGATLAEAGLTARNEIYPGAPHGFTMADTSAWDEAAFVRGFANLKDLLARTLHAG
jgi:carboxymethylenebutenolidase